MSEQFPIEQFPIEQFPIIDHFAITVGARVTWLADLRHQGTVTTTWPNGTADITWDTGWYSTRVPLTQLRRLAKAERFREMEEAESPGLRNERAGA